MRKYFLSSFALIVFLHSVSAQKIHNRNKFSHVQEQTTNQNKWAVTYTPTAAVLTPKPSYAIQPGFEYWFNRRLSLLTDLTFVAMRNNDSFYSNRKYFRIKPELRWNFEYRHRWLGSYIGLQLSYAYRQWDNLRSGGYFSKTGYEDSAVNFTGASIVSPIFTSSIQMGTILNSGKHLSFDFFWGMGTRTIFTNYSKVQNPSVQYYQRGFRCFYFGPPAAYTINHTLTRFHMNMGLRLIYNF